MKKLKNTLSLFLATALSLGLTFSVTPTVHAATYEYAVEGGNLKFDPTTGTITDCDSSVYSADIPSEIYGVPVTAIGKSAFSSCKKLSGVTIPSTVTSIGSSAFSGCSQLTDIVIPNSVDILGTNSRQIGNTFYACSALKTVEISGNIKKLPDYMFNGCKSLETVKIGDGVKEIGSYVFQNCDNLENITLPNSIRSIEDYAFSSCDFLESVTIGNGIKNIDKNAFRFCKNLTSIYFQGAAPSANDKIITHFADGFKIYYPKGAKGWTTPTWNGYITEAYTLPDTEPTTPQTPEKPVQPEQPTVPTQPQQPAKTKTANPTNDKLTVNGVEQSPTVYKIDGSNYFQIRDVAAVLNGTVKQFAVGYSGGKVTVTSGQPYEATGKELAGAPAAAKNASPSNDAIVIDGVETSLTVYKIGGSNYFKLRDLGKALDFNVGYSGGQVTIDTSKSYS